MSQPEIVIVVLGLLAGYEGVAFWLRRSRPGAGSQAPVATPPSVEPQGDAQQGPSDDAIPWQDVLGVAADAPVEQIRKTHRQLRSQYHPDKVAALGPELRALAERKSVQIQRAYRRAMQERGVPEHLW